eukprot:CAMPEP_0197923340 /NCGR_PEP_ID=MMETSP1439-20131203/93793_1 /TAXON_ID=66791 /ORGANISM="Gonyaulax spinifera, Strain CCMP409" /LENGTH=164 /DNA_ID=CAMNT_0043545701 /DNA_START=256 /DNA_END=750 /DNA_ORIENTATION=+
MVGVAQHHARHQHVAHAGRAWGCILMGLAHLLGKVDALTVQVCWPGKPGVKPTFQDGVGCLLRAAVCQEHFVQAPIELSTTEVLVQRAEGRIDDPRSDSQRREHAPHGSQRRRVPLPQSRVVHAAHGQDGKALEWTANARLAHMTGHLMGAGLKGFADLGLHVL